MMDILVLGGTRFTGRATARALSAAGHAVTVASRRQPDDDAIRWVGGERADILARLHGRSFDVVVDFIAYDHDAVEQALAAIRCGVYVLISSSWVARLRDGAAATDAIEDVPSAPPPRMLEVTWRYLAGKVEAERAVAAARRHQTPATIVRLPILWGEGDRTGRLEFYRRRFADGGPVIAVDGGMNLAQIAWSEDIAGALVRWLGAADPAKRSIWEGLPDAGIPVRSLLCSIAAVDRRAADLVDIPASLLERHLPKYLEVEPLWRERAHAPTAANLFLVTRSTSTPHDAWLARVCGPLAAQDMPELRCRERTLAGELRHA